MDQFKAKLFLLGIGMLIVLVACSDVTQSTALTNKPSEGASEILTVYKDPNCECCTKWITHLNTEGLHTNASASFNLEAVKNKYQIPINLRSCHTSVSTQGFVFEGHVAAHYIRQFLTHTPKNGVGLVVPGMPSGSPGMEIGNKFMPYQILLLNRNGSTEVYADIKNAAQQFNQSEHPEKPL